MTQPILDSLTDTQAVLSCAGLSAGDVGDSRLIASGLEDDLSIHLHLKLPTYKALVDAGRDPAATDDAKLILLAISNYARWYCASIWQQTPASAQRLPAFATICSLPTSTRMYRSTGWSRR